MNNSKVRAKKHLGQHFLTDKNICQKNIKLNGEIDIQQFKNKDKDKKKKIRRKNIRIFHVIIFHTRRTIHG